MDFHYLAQAPFFSDNTLSKVSEALQDFHNHKHTIVLAEGQKDNWEIPKLELLQGVIPDIHHAGPVMQWSVDPTEHAHMQEIKIPDNQDYDSQIACYLCYMS